MISRQSAILFCSGRSLERYLGEERGAAASPGGGSGRCRCRCSGVETEGGGAHGWIGRGCCVHVAVVLPLHLIEGLTVVLRDSSEVEGELDNIVVEE